MRWGLYAKWSVEGDGELRVFHDCDEIAEYHGANWLPDVSTPMWKAGIYTGDPGWEGPERYTVYEDDFRIFEE